MADAALGRVDETLPGGLVCSAYDLSMAGTHAVWNAGPPIDRLSAHGWLAETSFPAWGENLLEFGILPSLSPEVVSNTRSGQTAPWGTERLQDGTKDLAERIQPIIPLKARRPQRQFKVLQQWEGVVTEVHETQDLLRADLLDLTDPSKPREFADLPLAEISPADRSLIVPGCVFYWIIGHETSPGASLTRVSEIRVRRSPEWSSRLIEEIKAEGHELYTRFTSNDEKQSAQGR